MRKVALFLIAIVVAVVLVAQELQSKLAVMEIEDKSGKLSKGLLENAAEALRTEIGATNRFILISKDRQRKAMIKDEKKESWKECYDQACRIQLGQALTADSILTGIVNYFGGTYTLTAELIDLAKEATVKTAKAEFDGTEKGFADAIKSLAVQIAGTVAPVASGVDAKQIYNRARDIESADKERAIELYHEILAGSEKDDPYNVKARERLLKMGDAGILKIACKEENNAAACNEIGNSQMRSRQVREAFESYAQACELGNGWGCYSVAERYLYGDLGSKDLSQANLFYKRACDKGIKEGCLKAGMESVVGEYMIYAGGMVLDTVKQRMWQRDASNKVNDRVSATQYCENLSLGGYSDWRLPNIMELKGLIKGCASTNADTCRIGEGCLSPECWSKSCCCAGGKGPGEEGYYWQKGVWLGGGEWFFSSDAWAVRFYAGEVNDGYHPSNCLSQFGGLRSYDGGNIRCVRVP